MQVKHCLRLSLSLTLEHQCFQFLGNPTSDQTAQHIVQSTVSKHEGCITPMLGDADAV